jgi:hypothetical protein
MRLDSLDRLWTDLSNSHGLSRLLAQLPAKRGSDSDHKNRIAHISDFVNPIRYRVVVQFEAGA